MGLFSRSRDRRFCAFCKTRRRVYLKKHVGVLNLLGLSLLSFGITYSYWGETDPRGLVIFCLLAAASEFFTFVRWRVSVVCKLCGFDPILYKRSPERAAVRVREFFEKQMQRPEFQLSRSPFLELHRQRVAAERTKQARAWLEALRESTSSAGSDSRPVISPKSP